jgi:hypothetical protein
VAFGGLSRRGSWKFEEAKLKIVERLKEYQRAARIPALQCFVLTLRKDETCVDVSSDAKRFHIF